MKLIITIAAIARGASASGKLCVWKSMTMQTYLKMTAVPLE